MENNQQIYRDLILRLPHIAEIAALMLISRIKFDEVPPARALTIVLPYGF